jgi:hypothetical protein
LLQLHIQLLKIEKLEKVGYWTATSGGVLARALNFIVKSVDLVDTVTRVSA